MSRRAIPTESFASAIEDLIENDVTITYRVVARAVGVAVSSLTRSEERRQLVDAAVVRQQGLRRWRERSSKQSQTKLLAKLADQEQEILRLKAKVELLQASHKAVILAVGEFGGMSAWQRFFHSYDQALVELHSED